MKLLFSANSSMMMLLVLFCLASCEVTPSLETVTGSETKQEPNQVNMTIPGATRYLIKKGEQSSTKSIKKVNTSAMRFEVTFDKSAIYNTVASSNQADINKLYGMSDGNTHHHTNSARFGWRWFNNRLEIHAYTYTNSIRAYQLIDVVELDKPHVYELKLEDNKYVFLLNGKRVEMPRAFSGMGEGYQLYPYFGGDEKAPHDITIVIKDLN